MTETDDAQVPRVRRYNPPHSEQEIEFLEQTDGAYMITVKEAGETKSVVVLNRGEARRFARFMLKRRGRG